jgi:hypothetical protein
MAKEFYSGDYIGLKTSMIQATEEAALMIKLNKFISANNIRNITAMTSFVKGETITLIITYKLT